MFVAPLPIVAAVSPATGPTAGGTPVAITGQAFTGATSVRFGSAAATQVNVVSDSKLAAVTPPGTAGRVDVTVTTPKGTSATGAADGFTYTPPANTTTTKTTTGTTTTTKTSPATTTTTTTTGPAAKGPVARIVFVTMLHHGESRTLELRIRVSELVTAHLDLFAGRTLVVRGTFAAKAATR